MMIVICDHCRKEITAENKANIPLPYLPSQEDIKEHVSRVLQLRVYDNTRNDTELCLDCALHSIRLNRLGKDNENGR